MFTVSGCLFHWASKLQTLTALSSTESETLCLSEAMRHLLPPREIVEEIRGHMGLAKDCLVRMKSKVFEDNNGCIAVATLPKITPQSKHIGTACFFSKEHLNDLEILKVDTKEQKADIFTKAIDGPTFKTIHRLSQGWQAQDVTFIFHIFMSNEFGDQTFQQMSTRESHGQVPWQTSRSRPEWSSRNWKSFQSILFCRIPFYHPFGNQLPLHNHNILAHCHDGHSVRGLEHKQKVTLI
jgi:hypothetical protein